MPTVTDIPPTELIELSGLASRASSPSSDAAEKERGEKFGYPVEEQKTTRRRDQKSQTGPDWSSGRQKRRTIGSDHEAIPARVHDEVRISRRQFQASDVPGRKPHSKRHTEAKVRGIRADEARESASSTLRSLPCRSHSWSRGQSGEVGQRAGRALAFSSACCRSASPLESSGMSRSLSASRSNSAAVISLSGSGSVCSMKEHMQSAGQQGPSCKSSLSCAERRSGLPGPSERDPDKPLSLSAEVQTSGPHKVGLIAVGIASTIAPSEAKPGLMTEGLRSHSASSSTTASSFASEMSAEDDNVESRNPPCVKENLAKAPQVG
ncbi:unnamed protein product [Protopolystoma xenopodis]|uniref:Uncharacterized protein n=1 Tax=Protopolystoma xenopodis TaxID=117903 RepID=A0A3S5FCX8_9PLAT|nr:unnamed protein product [Protopolystoma xenopodis]